MCSPHARGWSSAQPPLRGFGIVLPARAGWSEEEDERGAESGVLPARAGVVRRRSSRMASRTRAPRTRGAGHAEIAPARPGAPGHVRPGRGIQPAKPSSPKAKALPARARGRARYADARRAGGGGETAPTRTHKAVSRRVPPRLSGAPGRGASSRGGTPGRSLIPAGAAYPARTRPRRATHPAGAPSQARGIPSRSPIPGGRAKPGKSLIPGARHTQQEPHPRRAAEPGRSLTPGGRHASQGVRWWWFAAPFTVGVRRVGGPCAERRRVVPDRARRGRAVARSRSVPPRNARR